MNNQLTILITNPNHHWLNAKPIIEYALEKGTQVKLLSFCGLRRLSSPKDPLLNKIEFYEWGTIFSKESRKASLDAAVSKESKKKQLLQKLIYNFFLLPFLKKHTNSTSQILIFNDAAYPMHLFCNYFNKKEIQYYLLQEGIRFPLPNVPENNSYGASGAKAIFCWGEEPKEHFLKVTKELDTKVYVTGAPRYIATRKEYSQYKSDDNTLGIFTNPIDQLGFCSLAEKQQVFENFVVHIKDWLLANNSTLLLKIHPGEQWSTYETVLNKHSVAYKRGPKDIFRAITMVKAGVIMASTVGLELLLFEKKLAQLPLPNGRYVFDYVDGTVAYSIPNNGFDVSSWDTWWNKLQTETMKKNRSNFLTNYLVQNDDCVETIYDTILD